MKVFTTAVILGIAFAAALLGASFEPVVSLRSTTDHVPESQNPPAADQTFAQPPPKAVAGHADSHTGSNLYRLNPNVISGQVTVICTEDAVFFGVLGRAIAVWNAALPELIFDAAAVTALASAR